MGKRQVEEEKRREKLDYIRKIKHVPVSNRKLSKSTYFQFNNELSAKIKQIKKEFKESEEKSETISSFKSIKSNILNKLKSTSKSITTSTSEKPPNEMEKSPEIKKDLEIEKKKQSKEKMAKLSKHIINPEEDLEKFALSKENSKETKVYGEFIGKTKTKFLAQEDSNDKNKLVRSSSLDMSSKTQNEMSNSNKQNLLTRSKSLSCMFKNPGKSKKDIFGPYLLFAIIDAHRLVRRLNKQKRLKTRTSHSIDLTSLNSDLSDLAAMKLIIDRSSAQEKKQQTLNDNMSSSLLSNQNSLKDIVLAKLFSDRCLTKSRQMRKEESEVIMDENVHRISNKSMEIFNNIVINKLVSDRLLKKAGNLAKNVELKNEQFLEGNSENNEENVTINENSNRTYFSNENNWNESQEEKIKENGSKLKKISKTPNSNELTDVQATSQDVNTTALNDTNHNDQETLEDQDELLNEDQTVTDKKNSKYIEEHNLRYNLDFKLENSDSQRINQELQDSDIPMDKLKTSKYLSTETKIHSNYEKPNKSNKQSQHKKNFNEEIKLNDRVYQDNEYQEKRQKLKILKIEDRKKNFQNNCHSVENGKKYQVLVVKEIAESECDFDDCMLESSIEKKKKNKKIMRVKNNFESIDYERAYSKTKTNKKRQKEVNSLGTCSQEQESCHDSESRNMEKLSPLNLKKQNSNNLTPKEIVILLEKIEEFLDKTEKNLKSAFKNKELKELTEELYKSLIDKNKRADLRKTIQFKTIKSCSSLIPQQTERFEKTNCQEPFIQTLINNISSLATSFNAFSGFVSKNSAFQMIFQTIEVIGDQIIEILKWDVGETRNNLWLNLLGNEVLQIDKFINELRTDLDSYIENLREKSIYDSSFIRLRPRHSRYLFLEKCCFSCRRYYNRNCCQRSCLCCANRYS